jgi:hypothetical protein
MPIEDYDDDLQDHENYLEKAQEELKRVDHQVYVTLKYTRTVDVLINVQQRMIEAYDALINSLLVVSSEDSDVVKASVIERTNAVLDLYDEPQVQENIGIYLLIRKVVRAKNITKESEYRRPVRMITVVDGQEVSIDIDLLTHYYAVLVSFYKFVEQIYKTKKVEEEN